MKKIFKDILCTLIVAIMCLTAVPLGKFAGVGLSLQSYAAETETLYRYREKEYLTSSNETEEGYTLYSSKWAEEPSSTKTVTYARSWPSGSSTTKGFKTDSSLYKKYKKPAVSETETTKTVLGDESSAKTVGYLYWHWCYKHDAGEILDCVIRDSSSGKVQKYVNGVASGYYYTTNFHAFFSSNALSFSSSASAYKKSSSSYCKYTFWWNGLSYGNKGNIEVINNTLYTYEKVYCHFRWSDWSEWSTTPVEASDNVEVEIWETGEEAGICGDNAYWTFDVATGTLTISGEGPTYDYWLEGTDKEDVESPFNNNNDIKKVIVNEGITTLGDYLLFGCCNIESIDLPETLTEIHTRSVDGKITEFNIGKNIVYVCSSAVEMLECLKKFTVDAENEYYSADEHGVLYNKDKTDLIAYPADNEATEFSIPDSVKFVSAGFSCANNLETVYIHKDVMSLSDGIFTTALGLEKIVVDEANVNYFNDGYGALYRRVPGDENGIILKCYPVGNTRNVFEIADGTNTIWHSVFNSDVNINTLIIPVSVTNMIWGALQCYNLSDIYYYGTEEQWNQIDIDEFNDSYLEDVTIHFNYKKTDTIIKKSGYCGENVTYKLTSDGTLTISGEGPMYDYTFYDEDMLAIPPYMTVGYDEEGYLCSGDNIIKNVIIEDGVTTIGDYAFHACTALESVEIADTVTLIGATSFDYCINLKNISIPGSVKLIKEEAFSESGLETIEIENGLEKIEQIAFLYCQSLKTIILPESVASIGDFAFVLCDKLETLIINNKDCEIGQEILLTVELDEEGYPVEDENGNQVPIECPTVLKGYSGSTAEEYANTSAEAGYPIKFEALNAHEHTVVTQTKNPSCTEEGYTIESCSSCEETISHEVMYALGHSFEVKQAIAATCTKKGFTLYQCKNSGCYLEKTDDYINPLGHSYTQQIIDDAHLVSKATYENKAVYKYDCSRCDSIGTETFEYGEKLVKENDNCSCNCHKSGFMSFIWKILSFFYKLFGINKVCDCGTAHY